MQQLLFAPFNKTKKAKTSFARDEDDTPTETWQFPLIRKFRVENQSGFVKDGRNSPLKYRDMEVKGLGLPFVDKTDGGLPQADVHVIKKLAGDNPTKGKYGIAYDHFLALGDEEQGKRISHALHAWIKFKQIETLLVTYILPL